MGEVQTIVFGVCPVKVVVVVVGTLVPMIAAAISPREALAGRLVMTLPLVRILDVLIMFLGMEFFVLGLAVRTTMVKVFATLVILIMGMAGEIMVVTTMATITGVSMVPTTIG